MSGPIAGRVAKGAALLDEKVPGWDARIDLATLNLASPCRCVVGQLFADLAEDDVVLGYAPGLGVLGFGPGDDDSPYGFDAAPDDAAEQYADLTAAWKRIIEGRRAA